MARSGLVLGTCLVISIQAVASGLGDETTLADLYGRGVHQYFERSYQQAAETLTAAIDQGSTDPRCYYFRGLARAQLNQPDEAIADFAKGAELEVSGETGGVFGISASLQRVQGKWRMELENQRAKARLAAHERAERRRQVRYEQLIKAEKEVLLDPERPVPQPAQLPPGAQPDPSDPFASGLALTGGKLVEVPKAETAPATPENLDPFARPAQPAAQPEATNPFAAPAQPAGEDPFGAPAAPRPGAGGPNGPAAEGGIGVKGLLDLLKKTAEQSDKRDPFATPPAPQPPPSPPGPKPKDPFANDPFK